MIIILAVLVGGALGYVLERGDFCFHSTIRGLFREPAELDLARAYILVLLLAAPLVQLLIATGVIEPWIPPFVWQANLFGGFIFGIGMVIAATCVTGLFYKLGHGMLGTLLGLAGWAIGDIITYRGPLSPWRDQLRGSPIQVEGQSATVLNLLGLAGVVILALVAAAFIFYLWRSPREERGELWPWTWLGVGVALVTVLAWPVADYLNVDYTFGTSGVPTTIFNLISEGSEVNNVWIPVTLVSIIPGALLAAYRSGTLWVRGETARRYAQLAGGGFLMGVGAGIAGGCNLGHSLVGVPLLSLGSIMTTGALIAGVFIAHQASFRPQRPRPK